MEKKNTKETMAKRWRLLSGEKHWEGLLDPPDSDLRRYLIHYGEAAQVTYDGFNREKASKFAGSCRFAKRNLFSKVGMGQKGDLYRVTKYIYATSSVEMPEAFILRSLSREAWSKESNWIGYVAVATEEGKAAMGRRDIVVAWRGTVERLEWMDDFEFLTVAGPKVFGEKSEVRVHQGWYSVYISDDQRSPFNKTSARAQVLTEVTRLVDQYQNEEISITITGHSLGAALATLNAVDISANKINFPTTHPNTPLIPIPVTAFVFACPRVGDSNFAAFCSQLSSLRLLRIRNLRDIVPNYPLIGYSDAGEEITVDTTKSSYLKSPGNLDSWHNLEAYLHGVAGSQGRRGGFKLEIERDIAVVNKRLDGLKEEYGVPASWWCEKNKGMVQQVDGSWKLMDHEDDDDDDDHYASSS